MRGKAVPKITAKVSQKDLFNYAAFLQSPLGGGWYSSEITKLRQTQLSVRAR